MRGVIVPLAAACLSLGLAARPAAADQCQWVPTSQAYSAAEWLARSTSWLKYCEPCGDTAPALMSSAPGPSVSSTSDPQLDQVKIDGQDIDLAYTFIPTGGGTYTNLALLVGCATQGVSRTVTLPATPSPTAPVAAPSETCKAAARTEALLTTALVVWTPWMLLILSLVGGAGFVLGAAFASRRRRRMTARALGLRDQAPPGSA